MNRVTEAIVNPAFMLGFVGAPLLTSVAGFLLRRNSWVIAGLVQNVAFRALDMPLNGAFRGCR